jgi:hypothetical protein
LSSPGTPAQTQIAQNKQNQNVSMLKFPSDLGDYFMSFDFYDYQTLSSTTALNVDSQSNTGLLQSFYTANIQSVNNAIAQSTSFARIVLPIPQSLVDNFSVQWEDKSLGLVAGLIGQGWQAGKSLLHDIMNGTAHTDHTQLGDFADVAKAMNNDVGTQTLRRIAAMGSPLFGDLTDLTTGVTENPNLTVLFRGPTLKQHQFSWRLQPHSLQESQTLDQIIGIFKRERHPATLHGSTTAFLKYPSECLAQFHGGTSNYFLYPLRPVIVSDFSINYAPNGMPAFFQSNEPVAVDITVRLQETSYYTRDSFDDQSQYGADGLSTSNLLRNPTGTDDGGDSGDDDDSDDDDDDDNTDENGDIRT